MELAYLPDNVYLMTGRYYHQDYSNNYKTHNETAAEKKTTYGSPPKINEKNCHICKEKRRKSLSHYIRTKSRRDSMPSTHIREEDEDEECDANCKMGER